MSEPKRYDLVDKHYGYFLCERKDGPWVKWEDYARLKAERDAIHSSKLVYFIHGEGRWANVVEENARLKAQAEMWEKNTQLMGRQLNDVLEEVARLKAQIDAKMEVGVPYADYDRLFAENSRLKASLEKSDNLVVKMSDKISSLKAQVERLTADLNKMTKTPDGVDYVEVDVSFWTKSGSRLPQSYSTFWSNDKGVQS